MGLDTRILDYVVAHRSAGADAAFRALTELGSLHTVVPIAAVTALVLYRRRDVANAVLILGVVIAAELVSDVLKLAFGRARPPAAEALVHATGHAFPSGHTTQATAFYGALAIVIARRGASRSFLRRIWCAAFAVAFAVGVSRVYLGVHWPSDVVAGWVTGACIVACAVSLVPSGARVAPG